MELPQEFVQKQKEGYRWFSWVAELATGDEQIETYFYKGKNAFQGSRFFWQTPDRSFSLVGLGQCRKIIAAHDLYTTLQQAMHTQQATYCTQKITGTGPLFFGGFPFDEESKVEECWQTLGRGLFYLPMWMITENQNRKYVTFNLEAESENELVQKWHEGIGIWRELVESTVNKPASSLLFVQQEKAVDQWVSAVEHLIKELQAATTLKKVVLARQLEVQSKITFSTDTILANLLKQQQNTYTYVLEAEQTTFMGATPERLLAATTTEYATACVAGSIARGGTAEEDERLGNELLNDHKNIKEHHVVVQTIAQALAEITDSQTPSSAPSLLKNRDIQHLYVPFSGKRKKESPFLQGIQRLHPTPALGGEPKEMAKKWIRTYEPTGRGLYGAPIGWVDPRTDTGEFAVGIRSAVFTEKQGTLYAGCGIVKESKSELERQETRIKFQPMLRAIGGNEG